MADSLSRTIESTGSNTHNVGVVAAAESAGTAHLQTIVQGVGLLPAVPIPKEAKVVGKEKEALLLYEPGNLQKLITEWNANVAHSPPNVKTARRLAEELLKAAEPQITLALAAPVYAYFFRSADLVISEDPLLLRKHRFFDYTMPGAPPLIEESVFVPNSEALGSHLQGGFAQFGLGSGFGRPLPCPIYSGWAAIILPAIPKTALTHP